MNEFLGRLKQRKLVQWAIAYIAAAFALLQGIDIVAQQFGWPESVRRGITLALIVGFFVTLVLAWYHGERGRQNVTGSELLIIGLVLALGGGLLWRFAATAHVSGHTPLPLPNEKRRLQAQNIVRFNNGQQTIQMPTTRIFADWLTVFVPASTNLIFSTPSNISAKRWRSTPNSRSRGGGWHAKTRWVINMASVITFLPCLKPQKML